MKPISADMTNGRRARPRRAGFVLAMALMLIALAAMSLAGFARRSLELAERAAVAQEDLQRRWGTISCQRVLLGQAENLLEIGQADAEENPNGWSLPAALSAEFTLGRLRFAVLVADEDAKVNLNTIHLRGPDAVRQAATRSLDGARSDALAVHVVPPVEVGRTADKAPFQSWGQIFEWTSPPAGSAEPLAAATREVTCWGSGRLNLRRASDEAVRLACEHEVSPAVVRKLLAERRAPDLKGFDDLLGRLALRERDRAALVRLTTDKSQSHSLWVMVSSVRRGWTTLVVDRPGHGQTRQQSFAW